MASPLFSSRSRTPRPRSPSSPAVGTLPNSDNAVRRETPPRGRAAAGTFTGMGGGGGDRASGAVRVVVRVRPQNTKEIDAGGMVCVKFPSEEEIELQDAKKTYDRVFDPSATQQEVFNYVAKPLVSDLFHGYNGTIFAYGQTSSGKTHTMEGPSIHDEELAGVIPRTVREIFFAVEEAPDSLEFVIKVSYIEIYMEKIRDLLDSYHTKMNLPVREDKRRGVYVAGATEEYVTSANELIAVMAKGAKNRVTAATGMNQGSSRSHSVFIISVQQRDVNDSSTKTGMLFLVDLAGSEMVKKTHATGKVLNEAKTINRSLSALGQVINALTDEKKPHVPYRDSKLTRVLQNSLGGNSKTCLIVNCSPSSFNEVETLSTLRFGSRAKRIQNKAVVNETRSVEELGALLSKAESAFDMQQTYIAALEKQLIAIKNGVFETPNPPPLAGDAEGGCEKAVPLQGTVVSGARAPSPSPRDEDTAKAIRLLTKRNQELQTEVDEEKAEVKRREQVSNELRQVLQEKENLLSEATGLLQEAESVHLMRMEASLSEKAELEAELETQRARVQEVTHKHRFETEEQALKLQKLTGENARLTNELQEITGDTMNVVPGLASFVSSCGRPETNGNEGVSPPMLSSPLRRGMESTSKTASLLASSPQRAEISKVTSSFAPSPRKADGTSKAGSSSLFSLSFSHQVLCGESAGGGHDSAAASAADSEDFAAAAASGVGDGELVSPRSENKVTSDSPHREGDRDGGRDLKTPAAQAVTESQHLAVADGYNAVSPATAAASGVGEGGGVERCVGSDGTVAAQKMEDLNVEALKRAGSPEAAIIVMLDRERRWRERDAALIEEQFALGQRYQQSVTEIEVLKRELATVKQNCVHLTADLQRSVKRRTRDKTELKLEQLASVHKKLLTKLNEKEEDEAALRKKVLSRDVSIAQLEEEREAAAIAHKTEKEAWKKELHSVRETAVKLLQDNQRRQQTPAPHFHPERRAVRGGGGSHQAQEVKTLRGGNGRRSHDEARPWGGLGFDVKNNTYASEPGCSNAEDDVARGWVTGEGVPSRARQSMDGSARTKGVGTNISPGRSEGGSLVEKLLRGAWTPKQRNII